MEILLVCFLNFLNQIQKRQTFSRDIILNNITVIDNECVYKKHDEIMGDKFNSTIQICCKGSGVYDKY